MGIRKVNLKVIHVRQRGGQSGECQTDSWKTKDLSMGKRVQLRTYMSTPDMSQSVFVWGTNYSPRFAQQERDKEPEGRKICQKAVRSIGALP